LTTLATAAGTDLATLGLDGRMMTMNIDMNNALWDLIGQGKEFVTKWTGACLRDMTSGLGGFCILETNDADTEATTYGFAYLDSTM